MKRKRQNESRPDMLVTANAMMLEANKALDATAKEFSRVQADLEQQEQALQLERQQMSAVAVTDDDIIHLNIGGTHMSTKRSTLTQAVGSALGARFNGSWEQCLEHDDKGCVFLDFDPYSFQQILQYLRECALTTEQTVPLPTIMPEKLSVYASLVRYLCLEQYMGYSSADQPWDITSVSPGVTLLGQQAHASCVDRRYRSVVIGDPIDAGKVCHVKFKLTKGKPYFFFLGVSTDPQLKPSSLLSQMLVSSYGWTSGGKVVTNGQTAKCNAPGFSSVDEVLLKVDLRRSRLVMRTSVDSPMKWHITLLPNDQSYTIFAVLRHGEVLELLPVLHSDVMSMC